MTLSIQCLLLVAVVAAVQGATTGGFNSRLDSVDVDKILANPRVLSNYVKCIVDKGPCTSEGKEIKKFLPEVLATSCANCTPHQKSNVKKTILAIRERYPKEWEAVVNKYDPKKSRAKDLETFLTA